MESWDGIFVSRSSDVTTADFASTPWVLCSSVWTRIALPFIGLFTTIRVGWDDDCIRARDPDVGLLTLSALKSISSNILASTEIKDLCGSVRKSGNFKLTTSTETTASQQDEHVRRFEAASGLGRACGILTRLLRFVTQRRASARSLSLQVI